MKHIFIFIFLLKFSSTFSQNIDSLKHLLNSQNTEQKKNTYLLIADNYYYSDSDSAELYLNKALSISIMQKNIKEQTEIKMKKGILYNEKGNILKAKKIFKECLETAEELQDTSLILSARGNIGNCYLNLKEYEKAIENYSEVIKIAEKNNNIRVEAIAYGALGNLYLLKKDNSKALKYYKISEEKFRILNNSTGIALSLMNTATIYSNIKKYKKAVRNYKEAEILFRKKNNLLNSAKCKSGMAKVYLKLKEFEKSIEAQKEALKMYKKFDSKVDIFSTYTMLAVNYINLKKYRIALNYLDSALNMKDLENNYFELEYAANQARICYDSLGNYAKAYQYSKLHKTYYDSVFNIEHEKKFTELEVKFETAKKEQEIELYKKNEELLQKESKNRLILLISVSSFFLLLIIILFLFYNRRKLKAEIIQSESENKLLRVQMNPHFIFNALSSIEHYIYKNDIEKSSLYIADFAKLMRLILESSRKEFINLSREIEILNYYIEFEKLRIDYPLDFSINISDDIDTENCLVPPMLIQPFIENAVKHGLNKEIKNASIKISMQLHGDFILTEIEDNGKGFKSSENTDSGHQSLSVQITKERLQKLFDRKHKKENKLIIQDLSETNPELHGTKISFKIPYIEEF